ncbi:MAG: GatB/YqeY domain-containing protein [Thermotogota bacterium]
MKKKLMEDMKNYMKEKNKIALNTVKMVNAEIKKQEIDKQKELSDEEIISIIEKQIKNRKDSAEQYRNAGRDELANQEEEEIKVLMKYLPEQMNKEEIEKIVDEVIKEVGAENKTDFGKVMGKIMPKVKGKADGTLVKKIVQEKLD